MYHRYNDRGNRLKKEFRQWKYKPTIINGTAVSILMKVHVSFTL